MTRDKRGKKKIYKKTKRRQKEIIQKEEKSKE